MNQAGGSVAAYLSDSAKRHPDFPALVSGAPTPAFAPFSFSELDQSVDWAAGKLFNAGIGKGQKTLLFVNPGPHLIIWAFALFRVGAIPVVIDPGMGIKSFLSCIRRTRPEAMVGVSRAFWISRLLPNSFRSVRSRYLVRTEHGRSGLPAKLANSSVQSEPDELAAIVFTSGSTGSPKGVRYLHQTFAAQIDALQSVFGMQPGEADLTTLPIFGLFNPALGITSVLPEMDPRHPSRADPQKLVRTLQDHRITTAFASPVIGKKVASACIEKNILLPEMNRFFLAGAPVPPDLVEQLGGCLPNGRVLVPYGATEALPVSSTDGYDIQKNKASILAGEGSLIGRPVPGAQVKILPNGRAPLPNFEKDYPGLNQGEVGEICVSGKMVTAGYDRMPGATCDARFKMGDTEFHRMGDLGYFDPSGCLRFLGRKAECVYTEYGPIETERCEPLINQLLCVQKCALIGLGSAPRQEPCLVVQPNRQQMRLRGEQALREEILHVCRDSFSGFRIQRVFFQKQIPVDARHNAKVHRLALSRKWTKRIGRKAKLGKLP
ncbi:MAG: fatty acid CoA ligase family protein [Opitutae bacterium]